MSEFLVSRGYYWMAQWGRLFWAVVSIVSFGYFDGACRVESWYLNQMTEWRLRRG